MSTTNVTCPYCGISFKVEADWIQENGRVFCGNCCKAFDAELEKDDPSDYYGDFYD